MKRISVILTALSMAVAAQAQLIDDFSGGLSPYTQTIVLDNAVAEANVSFSSAGGALVSSYGGTLSAAEQVVLLRGDTSLAVGNMLLVDTAFPTQTAQMDFGISVSAILNPTAASSADTDTRDTFNWAAVYVRPNQDAVRNLSSIGGVVTTAAGVRGAVETTVGQLFIERNTATDFTLGYFSTVGARYVGRTITFTATDVGTAIGFYGDLRAVGGSLGSLDNLRYAPVPEPSTAALLGLFGLVSVYRLRRSR
jgi:hypothetical protein